MADAFISYSRKNKEFVKHLNQTLINKHNKDAWVDWEDIKPGIHFWDEIKIGITHADSFITVVSPDSMSSLMCHLEISHAVELGKRIVPIIYEEVVPETAFSIIAATKIDKAMEDRLNGREPLVIAMENWRQISHINWIFFLESDGEEQNDEDSDFEKSVKKLVEAVETDIHYVKAHTRYLIRTQEWIDGKEQADLLLFGDEITRAKEWLQKSEKFSYQAEQEKVDVLHPMPGKEQRRFINKSHQAQKFRWRVGIATIISIVLLILMIVIVGTLSAVTISDTREKLEMLNQEITKANETLNLQYTAIAPTITDVEVARAYCVSGILLTEINRESVLEICNKAVELAPLLHKGLYQDFRGIVKAQDNDLAGALEDFNDARTYYQRFASNCVEIINVRSQWISDLEQGINPFDDPTTIDIWLNEPSLSDCDTS